MSRHVHACLSLQNTQLGLPSGEARLLDAAGIVVTTTGERLFAGGPLQLYELAHAVVPGEVLRAAGKECGKTLVPAEVMRCLHVV